MPFFAVAITTFNRSDILVNALNSVLEQTFTDYELLIVDDASPDNTKQVVQEFIQKARLKIETVNIIYHRLPTNSGINAVRNAAIQQANGQFLVYLDDDDRFEKNYLEQVYAALLDAPATVGFAIPGNRMYLVTPTGNSLQKITNYGYKMPMHFSGQRFIQQPQGGSSGLIVRITAAHEVGDWRTDFDTVGDTEYMLRLAAKWDYMIIPDATLEIYNLPGEQITKNRFEIGRSNELIGDIHADKFKAFPISRSNFYLKSATMYLSIDDYRDGSRVLWKALKTAPLSLYVWRQAIRLSIGTLFPSLFPNVLRHDRHGVQPKQAD